MPRASTRIDPAVLRSAAGEAAGALKILANPDRLLLLCQVSQGELSVGELQERLDIHQPTLSQQHGLQQTAVCVEAVPSSANKELLCSGRPRAMLLRADETIQ